MKAIEEMLTGQMAMETFTKLLQSNEELRQFIRNIVPQEAISQSQHPFWSKISHSVVKEYDFDYLRLLLKLCRFDGSLGDNLNIFATLDAVYGYYAPHLNCTTYYRDAFRFYLDGVGEYYEGPEVTGLLNQLVLEALPIKPKSKGIKELRAKLKEIFHIEGTKRPYWIQGGQWPMGQNSPMQFVGRRKISQGICYNFQDVDTGELREVVQYY